ncbi:hypothetical protein [Paraburkholderia sp. UCT2]|uniref:hypothetical protein n=1 Tax=Paraburkholderia sp. UCT2 TaxID=2615208 RepID=UPI001655B83F|nr:hypothetical protein [Paraburkholderia sp. UCT2]MBC8727947.1 hypothetical protein [Paraburkholderia sp. UCT2]
MSLSVFEMHSVELFCQRPLSACYVISDEWHYKACLRKAADLETAKADTREFLDIAGLNCRDWEEDRKLVERIIRRRWLWFHNVQDRNPDTDGWWVISALLDEVRRGALLAIKGRRTDLLPPPDSTPMTTFTARAVDFPNDGPKLFGRSDPATRQSQFIAAHTARGGSDLADDGHTSTLLGNVQPFDYQPDVPIGNAMELAGSEGRPRNNFAQNKQTNDVARVLRLTPDQAQQLHYELGSEPPMGFHEIMERAKDMFNLW